MDLRQPEVNIAITDLIKKKWIHIIYQITENKNRTMKIYHLTINLNDIFDELKESIIGSYEKKYDEIEQVRALLHNKPTGIIYNSC